MEKQEFLDLISQIGTCENDVERREMLATLSEEATKKYDEISSLTETNNSLATDNEDLRSSNMKLFKRIGTPASETDPEEGKSASKEKRDFKNLFNEKGDLK